jgi:predicted Zn-dependent protease
MRYLSYYDGRIALRRGRASDAIERFKETLRHAPIYWEIDPFEDCLANAYLELDQLDEAIAEYERILGINPNYPLVHYRLGQAYERKGQPDRVRAEYEQFLHIWNTADPDIPEIVAAKKRLAGES